jgi:cytochrome c biogenesis factor
MDNSTIGILSLIALLVVAVGFMAFTVVFMNRESVRTAQINRAKNQPVSNGYAVAAAVVITVLFVIVIIVGLLPPLLRRG